MRIHIKNTDFSKLLTDGVCYVKKEMTYNTFLLLQSGESVFPGIEVCEEETRHAVTCVILNNFLEQFPNDGDLSKKVVCHIELELKESFLFRKVLSIRHEDFKPFQKSGYGSAFVEMTYRRFSALTDGSEFPIVIIKDEQNGDEIKAVLTLADHEEGFRDDIEEKEIITPYFEFESKACFKEKKRQRK